MRQASWLFWVNNDSNMKSHQMSNKNGCEKIKFYAKLIVIYPVIRSNDISGQSVFFFSEVDILRCFVCWTVTDSRSVAMSCSRWLAISPKDEWGAVFGNPLDWRSVGDMKKIKADTKCWRSENRELRWEQKCKMLDHERSEVWSNAQSMFKVVRKRSKKFAMEVRKGRSLRNCLIQYGLPSLPSQRARLLFPLPSVRLRWPPGTELVLNTHPEAGSNYLRESRILLLHGNRLWLEAEVEASSQTRKLN